MRVATVDGLFNRRLSEEWYLDQHGSYSSLYNDDDHDLESSNVSDECKEYIRERWSWQQIIVVDGVTEIPEFTFIFCYNIKRVIFADTVVGIRQSAFKRCKNLEYIKLSLGLEFIGEQAFSECKLSSVFIPPRCRYIGDWSFVGNANLTILNVPRNTQLRIQVFHSTELYERSPFGGNDGSSLLDRVNTWLKNVNNDDQFALHRLCSSFEPTLDMILDTMKDKGGPKAFKEENIIGISPSDYLKENPFANVKEMDIIKGYVHKMMGEL